ncbi:MAG: RNA 3'-terminal phosphate cyclase [Euryarchaeota archaeon]|nr:RNA 3'-terminal phosphate cyclase [Euryarchaeota archaeon]
MIEIDGARGEGGGQVVRTAVAVSAAIGKAVHITNIRARRERPGLAAQHVAAVRCVAALCDAAVADLEIGSPMLTFRPGPLRPARARIDVGTAGSIPLVLQAGILAASFSPGETTLEITGGTDVRKAPATDYLANVTVPLLAKLGIRVSLDIRKRGYHPRGGGEVAAVVGPPAKPLAFRVEGPGRLSSFGGHAHVVELEADIAKRMADSAARELRSFPAPVRIEESSQPGLGPGTGITVWARTDHSVLGASALGERGLRAENVGAIAGRELAAELRAGASLDLHAADQLVAYLVLGGGGAFTVRSLSTHLETAMWLLTEMTGVRFTIEKRYGLMRVECSPGR